MSWFRGKIRQWTKRLSRDERTRMERILRDVPRDVSVLEIGCGYGKKLKRMQSLGFSSILGVEKNQLVVEHCVKNGLPVMSVDRFESERADEQFDLLVLSHIIEHFSPEELLVFMDGALDRVRPGGKVLILSPVLHPHFYIDLDHVKPYYPQSIKLFFGSDDEQVSRYSPHSLKLLDVYFRRSPYRIKFNRALLLKRGDFPVLCFNLVMAVLFFLSGGLFGRMSGWLGLYKKKK